MLNLFFNARLFYFVHIQDCFVLFIDNCGWDMSECTGMFASLYFFGTIFLYDVTYGRNVTEFGVSLNNVKNTHILNDVEFIV